MTERQKKALALKGDHKIYYERDLNDPMGFIAAIANLDECISQPDGSYLFPDSTPDWLYDVLEALGYMTTFDELMESIFEFQDEATMNEVKEICDVVIEK